MTERQSYSLRYLGNLAAAQARSVGSQRDEVAELMTPAQIADARRMTREWMAKH